MTKMTCGTWRLNDFIYDSIANSVWKLEGTNGKWYAYCMRPQIRQFDAWVIAGIAMWPRQFLWPMTLCSFLGQPPVVVGVAALLAGTGLTPGGTYRLVLGLGAIATLILTSILKLVLRRKRPATNYVARMWFSSYSFPSGHAAGAAACYGAVIVALFPIMVLGWWLTVAIPAIVLVIAIGVSRVYLGAHFPSDVLAGWAFGLLGLGVSALIALRV